MRAGPILEAALNDVAQVAGLLSGAVEKKKPVPAIQIEEALARLNSASALMRQLLESRKEEKS